MALSLKDLNSKKKAKEKRPRKGERKQASAQKPWDTGIGTHEAAGGSEELTVEAPVEKRPRRKTKTKSGVHPMLESFVESPVEAAAAADEAARVSAPSVSVPSVKAPTSEAAVEAAISAAIEARAKDDIAEVSAEPKQEATAEVVIPAPILRAIPQAIPRAIPIVETMAPVKAQPLPSKIEVPRQFTPLPVAAKPVAPQIVRTELHPAPQAVRTAPSTRPPQQVAVEVTPMRMEMPAEMKAQVRARRISGEVTPALLEMPADTSEHRAKPQTTTAAKRISGEITPVRLDMPESGLPSRVRQTTERISKELTPVRLEMPQARVEPKPAVPTRPLPPEAPAATTPISGVDRPALTPVRRLQKPAAPPRRFVQSKEGSLKLRSQFREVLFEIKRKAATMKIDHRLLPPLLAKVEREHFRVAVVGKSNCGKSTFINALLGIPGLLPTDSLPGAPTVIEVKPSTDYSFERTQNALSTRYVSSDADSFRASVLTPPESDAVDCARWRVGVPSDHTRDMAIDLVDTPPLGEAADLDRQVVEETLLADAIFFLLDITQAPSAGELQLIGDLASQTEGLFVVFNRADTTHPTEWPSIERDITSRLKGRGLRVPARGFHFLSALRAESTTAGKRSRGLWHTRISEMREDLRGYLRQLDEAAKLESLARGSERLVASFRQSVKAQLTKLDQNAALEGADTPAVQETVRLSVAEAKQAHEAVEQARALLEHSDPLIHVLMSRFWAAWPSLGNTLCARKGKWTSDFSPVLAPKKHVEEVARKAKEDTVALVQRWMVDHGGPIIEEELQGRIDVADHALAPLAAYLRHKGFSENGMDREHWQRVLGQAFQGPMGESEADLVQTCGSLAATVASGTLSVVVGYVVADVVLFYMLGLVGGFLSPPLLLAALGAGTALHFFVGRQAVVGRIQNKVHRTIVEKVAVDNNRLKLDHAVNLKVGELLQKLAQTFASEAHELVERAERGTLKVPAKQAAKSSQRSPDGRKKDGVELLAALSALDRFSHQVIGPPDAV